MTPFDVQRDFGAQGDGVTDDTASIAAAVQAAYAAGRGNVGNAPVFFPAGRYRIAGDNPLGNILSPNQQATGHAVGLHFVGQGKFNSVLVMDTSGASSAKWMYNPPAGFTTAGGVVFRDLGFQGSVPDADGGWAHSSVKPYANGFKITGTNLPSVQNQNISFVRCAARGFQTLFDFEGDAVASEISHHNCTYGYVGTAVYLINNGQSVNHRFFGTDIEMVYGDVVQIGVNGGGSLQFFSGSIIMSPDGTNVDRWMVHAPIAVSMDPIEFYSIRAELRGNFSNLVSLANLTLGRVIFHGGRVLDQATATKTKWLQIGDYSRVDLTELTLSQQNGGATNVSLYGTGLGGEVGTVLFDKCTLPADFSDQCSINYVGCISALHCAGSSGQGRTAYSANDFTLNGLVAAGSLSSWTAAGLGGDGGTSCLQPSAKLAYLKCWPDYWPKSLAAEQTLKLPRGAIIKSIHLMYPGGGLSGFSTNPTYLRVTNNDYSVVHAAVSVGSGGTAAQAHIPDYFYAVNSSANERTLRLSFGPQTGPSNYGGVAGNNGGGIALVEYF